MIIQSALKEPSKKNKESVESDPKANGAQDELFEIRSSRRHSAQMRVIVLIECENNREEILTERKRDAIVRRHWRDRKNREYEKVFKMCSHFFIPPFFWQNDLLLWKQHSGPTVWSRVL